MIINNKNIISNWIVITNENIQQANIRNDVKGIEKKNSNWQGEQKTRYKCMSFHGIKYLSMKVYYYSIWIWMLETKQSCSWNSQSL